MVMARKHNHRNSDIPTPWKTPSGSWRVEKRLNGSRFNAQADTPAEAIAALWRKIDNRDLPKPKASTRYTIDAALREYNAEISIGDGAIAKSTSDTYNEVIKSMLRPEYKLTGTAIEDLSYENLSQFRKLLETVPAPKTGKPFGASRRKKIETRLNATLNWLVAQKRLTVNPFPKADSKTKRINAEQREQSATARNEAEAVEHRIDYYPQIILRYIKENYNHQIYVMFLLSFHGCRPQEARAVKREDISISKKELTINGTKSPSARRTIPIPPNTELHRALLRGNRLHPELEQSGFILKNRGKMWRQQDQNEEWRNIIEGLQQDYDPMLFPMLRLYANRHITATILARANTPRETLNHIMGWSNKTGTMTDIYVHQSPPEIAEALKNLDGVLVADASKALEKAKRNKRIIGFGE